VTAAVAVDRSEVQTEYLVVVQAPCYRIDERSFATESAFAEHLRVLQRKLLPRFERIWVAAPQYPQQFYRDNSNHLGHIVEEQEGIFYLPLNSSDASMWTFWTKEARGVWGRLREMTRRSRIVHGGLASDVFRPTLLLANISAKLDGCKTLFMVDIDFRRDAWRFWKTGQWSLKSYVVCSLVYDPVRLAQIWAATRLSSLLLLKSASMVRDFGRGRPNVRNFWDTAHSLEQVIDAQALEGRLRRLEDRDRPISLIYFGRFVPYKGLKLMIEAVWKARCASGRSFVLDLVGSGDELPNLRAWVEELGAGAAIRFNAPLPYGPLLFSKIRQADLMLATPLSEDTPRSAFDAMASGLPILGFDIDYYLSLAAESRAVETSPWPDVDVFAQRIVSLDEDRDRLATMSRAGADFARANTQEIWLDRRVEWTLDLLEAGEKSSFTAKDHSS
jgi:glycosyltransferase involved in cell wall biosynthesis